MTQEDLLLIIVCVNNGLLVLVLSISFAILRKMS